MDDCCNIDTASAVACPACGETGPVVGAAPVRSHRADSPDGAWQHCATVDCPVVFHLNGETVTSRDVVARVGAKAIAKPEPVCFCFAHTREAIAVDLVEHDDISTIKDSIKVAVAAGLCACEHLNPDGSCCLAAVHRTIKSIRADATVAASAGH